MGTMKDCGLAGGVALILFNQDVALPSLIFAIFTLIHINWLKYKMRHIISGQNNKKKEVIKI
jgi:predicted Na+-dependent transporter